MAIFKSETYMQLIYLYNNLCLKEGNHYICLEY